MEPTPDEDAVKMVEMTAKDLKYYTDLVAKAVARFERTDSYFERHSAVGKCCQTAPHATEKLFLKGRINQCSKFCCCLILRKCHNDPKLQQPPPGSVRSHQHQGKTLHQQKDSYLLKPQIMFNNF